jgi:hypothetical protein
MGQFGQAFSRPTGPVDEIVERGGLAVGRQIVLRTSPVEVSADFEGQTHRRISASQAREVVIDLTSDVALENAE